MRAMVVEEYGTAPALCEFPDPLVLGVGGVARRAYGTLVHFFASAPPYGAFAERVPLAEAETVPLPGGLDPSRAATLGISGVAAWTALAGTAGALATLAAPAIRNHHVSILTYAIFMVPARERCDAFTRLAQHAAAGELTVDYYETGLEALPAIWDNFAAGRTQTKIIVTPGGGIPS